MYSKFFLNAVIGQTNYSSSPTEHHHHQVGLMSATARDSYVLYQKWPVHATQSMHVAIIALNRRKTFVFSLEWNMAHVCHFNITAVIVCL